MYNSFLTFVTFRSLRGDLAAYFERQFIITDPISFLAIRLSSFYFFSVAQKSNPGLARPGLCCPEEDGWQGEGSRATHLPQHDVPFKETPSRAPGIEKRLKSVCE